MLKNTNEPIVKEKLGGNGKGKALNYPTPIPDMDGVFTMATRFEMEPGSSISYHKHAEDEEIYCIAAGDGDYCEDIQHTAAHAGDIFLCRKGHSHSLENTGKTVLVLYAAKAQK